jgi:hypothetical protein
VRNCIGELSFPIRCPERVHGHRRGCCSSTDLASPGVSHVSRYAHVNASYDQMRCLLMFVLNELASGASESSTLNDVLVPLVSQLVCSNVWPSPTTPEGITDIQHLVTARQHLCMAVAASLCTPESPYGPRERGPSLFRCLALNLQRANVPPTATSAAVCATLIR